MIQRMFVTLDTKKTNYKNVGKINHGDDLILELTVLSDGNMISFNDPMVDLLVKKSDGKMIRQNSGIEHIKPNKFIIEVSKDCVTSPGLSTNQLVINDNGRISTCMFYYTILNSLEEDVIQSISNVEVLEQLDEYVIEARERMELLNNDINKLEEFFGATSDTLVEAEMARNEAEQKRVQSEILRVNNENDRIEADNIRNQNDSIRNQNEVDRSSSELVREQRESERILNEEERRQNESERMIDESTRQQNENARQSNESVRISNENDRKTQENRRVTAETNRVNAETTRRNNENSRISNEIERQKAMNEMKSLLEDAREFDERVDVIEEEIGEIKSTLDNKVKQIEEISYKSINHYKLKDDKDYTEAFRRYFQELKEGKKITLVINEPLCEISEQILLPYGVYISIVGYGIGNVIRYVGKSGVNVFYCRYGDLGEIEGVDKSYLQGEIKNLRFETSVNDVILFKQLVGYINNFSFKDCIFSNFKYSIWFEKGWWTNISGCDFINGENGVMLFDANSSRIINTYFRFMSGTAITYDSDLTYVKRGTAGINLAFVNFEQVDVGVRLKTVLSAGQMNGCYWECNKNRPAIYTEDTGGFTNFTLTANYARYDNVSILNNLRTVTINGGHMPITLPTTTTPTIEGITKSVQNLMILNNDYDYFPIYNKQIHDGEILDLTFLTKQNSWNALTSNYPYTVSRESITVQPNEEVIVANGMANRTFRLLNFFASGMWKATIRVYKGSELVYSEKADIGESSLLKPLYKIDNMGSIQTFTIKVANETTSAFTLNNFTLSYLCNCYKS